MAGVTPPGAVQYQNDQAERAQFANAVASQTGLDPRVVSAWAQEETGGHPYGGFHNWLNLRPYPGDPYSGVSPGNFEEYSSLNDAVAATVRRLNQPFAAGIRSSAGQSPASQISAIAASGWDAGHYGGAGGPRLRSVFDSLWGHAAEGKAVPAGSTVGPQGPGEGVAGPGGAVGGIARDLSAPFRFLTSWRLWEVVGGFLLLLIGLYLLGRQFGLPNALGFTPAGELAKRGAEQLPGVQPRQNSREYRRGQREGRLSASRSAGREAGASTISRGTRRAPTKKVVYMDDRRPRRPRPASSSDPATNEIPF